MYNRHGASLFLIILFLIPSVSALNVNIKDNSDIKLNKKPAEVLYNDRISNNLISNNGVNL